MRLVHISGSPGCGKSTVAGKISKWPSFHVVDMDELLTLGEINSLGDIRNGDSDVSIDDLWRTFITQHIERLLTTLDPQLTVVFVGILEHRLAPGARFPIPLDNVQKFFLDPPLELLLCQWYNRIVVMLKKQPLFAAEVSNGTEVVMSSRDFLERHNEDRRWHLEQGYESIELDPLMLRLARLSTPSPE